MSLSISFTFRLAHRLEQQKAGDWGARGKWQKWISAHYLIKTGSGPQSGIVKKKTETLSIIDSVFDPGHLSRGEQLVPAQGASLLYAEFCLFGWGQHGQTTDADV